MAIGNDADPSLGLLNADGFTPQGEPYVVIVPEGELLSAGGLSAIRELGFTNPQQRPIDFTPRWIAPVNQPPAFITIPEPRAAVGQPWTYAVGTIDGNGDPVTLQLRSAPNDMTIVGGEVLWTPAQVGNYELVIEASDGRGGIATQGFTVQVSDASFNRPPVFTSSPETQRPVGATYVYDAAASDLDGDALSFSLQAAPAGLTVDPVSGEVRWDNAQRGQHSLVLNVDDGRGGQATQAWTLYVGEPALTQPGPAFSSVPVTYATPGVQYRYVYRVNSPLPAAPVVSLSQAPPTMVLDTVAGTLTWVPTGADLGSHVIELLAVDSNGEEARQRFDLQVLPTLPNQPPYLTSSPILNARIGSPYTYLATAIDPEFETLTFSLAGEPVGMTIDPTTGQVDWLPQAADPSTNDVTVQVQDPQGGQASQSFTIQLRSANVDPVITTSPETTATVGEFYSTRFLFSDADGDPVRFALLQGPPSMTLHPTLGWLHWTTTGQLPGVYPIVLEITDDWGGRQELSFDLTLLADTEAPVVAVTMVPAPACQREPAAVCVVASDNVGLIEVSLTLDSEVMTLDASRCTLWTPPESGLIPVLAVATDPSGLTSQDTTPLTVIDCNDEQAPVVTLETGLTGEAYNQPVPIVVTIDDNTPDILTWEVTQRALDADEATLLASGSGPVTSNELAVFDPTVLAPGDFEITVLASDGAQTGGIQFIMASGTGNKPGRVQFSVADAVLPVGGIPVSVGRSYDSLEASSGRVGEGDFGPGWRLMMSASVTDTAADLPPDSSGFAILAGEPFTTTTRVTITKPNGEVVGFRFAPELKSFPAVFQYQVNYEPDPGVTDTLRAVGWPDTVFQLGAGFADYIIPYNPSRYELETEDGLVYVIDEFEGLIEVRDVLGGVLSVTPDGLQSSWGVSVDYLRDEQGRIIEIRLPDDQRGVPAARVFYHYDALGNLVAVTDLAGNDSTFVYDDPDHPHLITAMFDPEGNPIARHVFDEEGRLIAHCPADGNFETLEGCSLFQFDTDLRSETIFDPRGFRSDLFFTEDGLLSARRDFHDAVNFIEQTWTYDEAGQILEYRDGDGGLETREYDEEGNELRRILSDGEIWTWQYDQCPGEWIEQCDPLGNCQQREFDADCRLTRVVDALGFERQFDYDERGLLVASTDELGQQRQVEYDSRGLVTQVTDASGQSRTFQYNTLGQITRMTDRNGQVREFVYDDGQRLIEERWPDVGTWGSYEYSDQGLLTRMATPDSTVDIQYWPTGQARRVDHTAPGAPSWWMEYDYDGSGNVEQVRDSAGGVTEYDYDGFNRLISVRQSGAGVLPKRVDIESTASGLPLLLTRYADLEGTVPGPISEYSYDCPGCAGRLVAIEHRAPGGGVIQRLDYQRDAAQRIVAMQDEDGLHQFILDGRGWLVDAVHPPASGIASGPTTWDAAGNWLTRPGAQGAALLSYAIGQGGHRLLSDDVHDYSYTGEGQWLERTNQSDSSVLALGHSRIDRIASVELRDAMGQPLSQASYVHAMNGWRVSAVRDGQARHYLHDFNNPAVALNDAGEVVWRRLYSRFVDRPLAIEREGQLRWLLTDNLGTVRKEVDSTGQVLADYRYDAFGHQVSGPVPSLDDSLRYTSRDFDLPGGLGYYRARVYAPSIARFVSEDPIVPWHFRYGDNNPLIFSDPTGELSALEYGLIICDIATGIGTALPVAIGINSVFAAVVKGLNGGGGTEGAADLLMPPSDPWGGIKALLPCGIGGGLNAGGF